MILADKNRLKSIAFPAISTGIFGFPKDRCATTMLSTTKAYVEGPTQLERVVYCLYDQETLETFKSTLKTPSPNTNRLEADAETCLVCANPPRPGLGRTGERGTAVERSLTDRAEILAMSLLIESIEVCFRNLICR